MDELRIIQRMYNDVLTLPVPALTSISPSSFNPPYKDTFILSLSDVQTLSDNNNVNNNKAFVKNKRPRSDRCKLTSVGPTNQMT